MLRYTAKPGWDSSADSHGASAAGPTAIVYVGEGHEAATLDEGLARAQEITPTGAIVLAVKTWR